MGTIELLVCIEYLVLFMATMTAFLEIAVYYLRVALHYICKALIRKIKRK